MSAGNFSYSPGTAGAGFTNPFAGIGGTTTGKNKFAYNPDPVIKSTPLTVQQYIKMQDAKTKKPSQSFLDEISHAGSEAFHPVAWTLDKLLRPEHAVAAATDNAITSIRHGGSLGSDLSAAGKGAYAGITGKSKEGFGQVLQHQGLLKGHGTLRGLAGFGLDIAADPLTYLTGGADAIATHGAEHAALVDAGKVALDGAADKATMAAARDTLAKGGEKYAARHALASTLARGGAGDLHDASLVVQREMALAEQKAYEKFIPQLQYGSRTLGKKVSITPTSVLGHQLPALPKLDNFIAHAGVGSGVAEKFRNAFIRPAGESPLTHQANLSYRHTVNQLSKTNEKLVMSLAAKFPKLKIDEILSALHHGETTKNFIYKSKAGNFHVNEIVIHNLEKSGKINAHQAEFLRQWHKTTEALAAKDKSFGVEYEHHGETGHLYVPHLVDKSGNPLSEVQRNFLTKAGFQHGRSEHNFSVAQLAQFHKAGDLPHGIETNPFILLAHTARQRAMKQADMAQLHAFTHGLSVKTVLVDAAKAAKSGAKLSGLEKAQTAKIAALGAAATAREDAHGAFIAQHAADHQAALEALDAKARSIKYGTHNATTKANPDIWFDHMGRTMNPDDFHDIQLEHSVMEHADYMAHEEQQARFAEDANAVGLEHPHEEFQWTEHHLHNIHDKHGNVIGSLHYQISPHEGVHIHSAFIRPDSRGTENFQKLVAPILDQAKKGQGLSGVIMNPRLHRVAELMGKKYGFDTTNLIKGYEKDGANAIKRGQAAAEPLPRLIQPNKLKAAQLANIAKQRAKIQVAHGQELAAMEKGTHEALNKVLTPHEAEITKNVAALKNISGQEKILLAKHSEILKGKPNKAFNGDTHAVVDAMKDEHGHPLAYPTELAGAIKKDQAIRGGNDKAIQAFANGYRRMLSKYKIGVTTINPGYAARNSLTEHWAMYLSGMPLALMPKYETMATKLILDAKRGNPDALAKMAELERHGNLSGFFRGDVGDSGEAIKYSGSKRSLMHAGKFGQPKPLRIATKAMQDFNVNRENVSRIALNMFHRSRGQSMAEASSNVRKALFDYQDLTPFEQKYMKSIAPFYTWMRKNVPFQLKSLISKPGQYSAFPKFMQESEQASGGDKGNILPSYISDSQGFQIPFGKHNYYLPQIGTNDLQMFDSAGGAREKLLGLLSPALKIPMELATNRNTFSGAQIASDTHPRNPVSNLGADLLRFIPGSNVGQTSRVGPGGKEIVGPGANPYYQYLLGQLPLGNELGIRSGGIKRGSTPIPPELSYLGGQHIQHVDPAQQRAFAQIALNAQVKKQVGGLRDEGKIPRAKRPKVKAGSNTDRINRALNLSLGRR